MILGEHCTRACRFCAVKQGPLAPPDPGEPERVRQMAERLKLRHVVVTSVTRDDLPDGGAQAFVSTIQALKTLPQVSVEVLTPDFAGLLAPLLLVLHAQPHVFNHNLETVRRLQPQIRPQADYMRSLEVLREAAASRTGVRVKSGLMVGLGETDEELREALHDLVQAGCEYLTLGQYLAPSRAHEPVDRFVLPETFEQYRIMALKLGFKAVASAPLVRSSYQAERMLTPPSGTSEAKISRQTDFNLDIRNL